MNEGHYILSGEVNSGKSTFLWDFFLKRKSEGVKVSGWICLPDMDTGTKQGYKIVFISDSEIHPPEIFMRETRFDNAKRWRSFWLNESVFDKMQNRDFGVPQLFVVDEVGPLELDEKGGFWPVLAGIYSKSRYSITVVRNSCLKKFVSSFPQHKFQHMNVT